MRFSLFDQPRDDLVNVDYFQSRDWNHNPRIIRYVIEIQFSYQFGFRHVWIQIDLVCKNLGRVVKLSTDIHYRLLTNIGVFTSSRSDAELTVSKTDSTFEQSMQFFSRKRKHVVSMSVNDINYDLEEIFNWCEYSCDRTSQPRV